LIVLRQSLKAAIDVAGFAAMSQNCISKSWRWLEGRGNIRRLMIFMPPRHGKSLIGNQMFPAWYLGRHPDRSIITASYGQDLADDFGRRVRNLVSDPIHRAIFPECRLADDATSMRRFGIPRAACTTPSVVALQSLAAARTYF
jgi:hypothetical protein